jgi:arginyl-tRNA synthetase
MRKNLVSLVAEAIVEAQRRGLLPQFEVPEVPLERPKQEEYGDYATPIAMQLARKAGMSPMKIAEAIASHLPEADYLGKVEVAIPGYINFILDEAWLARQVEDILAKGNAYGNLDLGEGKKVQVEYVSANPTGPLTVGSGRNAAIGDTLANVLEACGYDVQREYYINDAGTQIRLFKETLYARYAQAFGEDIEIPEKGYLGKYMVDLAMEIAEEEGENYLRMPHEDAVEAIGELGLKKVLKSIKEDLESLGIRYDRWFSERSLYKSGLFERVMEILRRRGYIEEREGAVWFKAMDFGCGKDEVIVRSTGEPGYFASDIAYHYEKFFLRGFDWVIDVWGADHQGHVPRMKAMMRAFGIEPERLTLLIYQLVTLKRGGEVIRLSKRTGDIITLREVMEEVGSDAVRFFLLARAPQSQMEFDLDLAKEQSSENPVYYVQYAHARICSILRYAGGIDFSDGDVSLLRHPRELALIRLMMRLPEVVEQAAVELSPHHLAYYAQDLAEVFHIFYRDCRVVSSDPADADITKARLKLVSAARLVLAKTLQLMGISAPESM